MSRPSTLENPFAEPKHRSTDDPKFVGKILGPEAEAAMRKVVADNTERAKDTDQKGDLELTASEFAKIAEEGERRKRALEWMIEQKRREISSWATENTLIITDEWIDETFTIHLDGTLSVDGSWKLNDLPVTHLPKGLTRIDGNFDLSGTHITSLAEFPQEIGGSLNLRGSRIISLKGLPQKIGGSLDLSKTKISSLDGLPQEIAGNIDLRRTKISSLEGLPRVVSGDLDISDIPITSLHGLSQEISGDLWLQGVTINSLNDLPPPGKMGGKIHFSDDQQVLIDEAVGKGYHVTVNEQDFL